MGQLVFQATLGGQVNLVGPNTASTFNINVPAVAGNMVTTGDTGTVTNTMLASSAYTAPGTIGSGTPNTGSFTSLAYSTTLTGGTGIVNLGSGQFYKDASGNIVVGGTTPVNTGASTGNITINGSGNAILNYTVGGTAKGWIYHDATNFEIYNNIAGAIKLFTNGSERMQIDSSGNVGIGTNSPSAKLDVQAAQGRIKLTSTTGTNNTLAVFTNTGGNAYVGLDSSAGGLTSAYALNLFHEGAYPIIFSTNDTERMRIDSSGNLGVGTSSPSYRLDVSGNIIRYSNGTYEGFMGSGSSLAGGGATDFNIRSEAALTFATGGGTERARIDSSGNLLVGTTTSTPAGINAHKLVVERTTTVFAAAFGYSPDSVPRTQVTLFNSNGAVGVISTSGSSTTYATSSDYRLKNTVEPMTGALAKVAALKPVTYKWNVDGSDGEGFIAHELQSVVPDAVFGEKDAVDADGNPVYQGIDTSFLVATLTAAIQEQQALITQLQAQLTAVSTDVAALKGN